ncbi:DNA repair ATPase [Catenovulum agarivorans DS-2]|uniref:DNA repair ATPase n=1 Tax=Catenovulum agarivorans DS-2 TaxID=1328313 RepID=W7QLA9_9ALTE|nr:SbcC/MukB-like Walker B domain-containing protein [Catenovulum agarivorans]EWH08923.1 DNA repair ATPase [Catenovulum agarivorans DS-2]
MKILSLRLKNLNALKGDWKIDFTQEPFASNGLFVITGATGAGKSTLLDAICLALYHQTPRLNVSANHNQIMTRHTSDCLAEVEFAIKNNSYKASWFQRRARGDSEGKLQPPKAELYHLESQKLIADKLPEVKAQVEQLSGLNFARFTKSILLSQGRFAEFLNAKSNEKAELLEELTGTEIYSQISKQVFTNYKSSQQALQKLTDQQSNLNLLSDEEMAELLAQKHSLQQQSNHDKTTLAQYRQKQHWLEQKHSLHQQLAQAQSDLQQAELAKAQSSDMSRQLERAQAARQCQPVVEKLAEQQEQQQQIQQQIGHSKQAVEQTQAQVDRQHQQVTQAQNSLNESKAQQQKINQDIDTHVRPLEQALQLTEQQHQQLEHSLTQHQQTATQNKQALANSQNKQQQNQQALSKCKSWLEQNSGLNNLNQQTLEYWQNQLQTIEELKHSCARDTHKIQTISEQQQQLAQLHQQKQSEQKQLTNNLSEQQRQIEKLIAQQIQVFSDLTAEQKKQLLQQGQTTLTQLEQIVVFYQQLHSQQQKITQTQKQLEDSNHHISRLTPELEELRQQYKNCKQQLTDVTTIIEQQKTIMSLEAHRHDLKEDEPCPLCGSVEHPFAKDLPNIAQPLKAQQQRQQTLTHELAELEAKGSELKSQIEKHQHQQNWLLQQLANEQQNFDDIEHKRLAIDLKSNWPDELICPEFVLQAFNQWPADATTQLETVKQQLQNHLNSLSTSLQLDEQIVQAQHQCQLTLQQNNNLSAELASLAQQQSALAQQQQELQQHNTQTHNKQQQLTEQLRQQLVDSKLCVQQQLTELEFTTISQIIADAASQITEYQNQQQRFQTLEQQRQTLATEIDYLSKQRTTDEQVLQQLQQQVKELEVQLTQQKADRQKWFDGESIVNIQHKSDSQITQAELNFQTQQQNLSQLQIDLSRLHSQLNHQQQTSAQIEQTLKQLKSSRDEKLAEHGFSDHSSWQQALLNEDELNALSDQLTNIEQNVLKYQSQQANIDQQIQLLAQQPIAQQLSQFDHSDTEQINHQQTLAEAIQSLELSYTNRLQQLGEINQQYQHAEKLKQNFAEVNKQIEQAQIQHQNWALLNELIGSAEGDKFRKFAQGLTLQQLVYLANQQLQHLHDRYQLVRKSQDGLDLAIIDTWQNDVERDTQTLSGGESFLVSLALALALSDLVSHKTNIESLFLDEGFGTLDSDTLDLALDALDRLNASGKMIGIISHIDSLKERIPVQIRVNKHNGLGYSQLERQYMAN